MKSQLKKLNSLSLLLISFLLIACEETEPFKPNHNPEIVEFGVLGAGVESRKLGTFICLVTDEDDDSLTYTWSSPGGSFAGSGDTVMWLAPAEVSRYPVFCHVEDGRSGYVDVNFEVQVFPQYIPEYEWTIYNRDNSGLPSNLLWDVAITSDDMVWTLDESHDASRFDGENWVSWDIASWDDGVNLDVDSQGNAWVTAATNWVAKVDESGFTLISHEGWSNTITVDKEDNIWVGGTGYNRKAWISKFDGDDWTNYDSSSTGVDLPFPVSMAFDSKNNLWYVSQVRPPYPDPSKLVHFNGSDWFLYDCPSVGWRGAIAIDHTDRVWVGTESGELASFYQNVWTIAPGPPDVFRMSDMEIVNNDEIWCIFESGGLARANRNSAYLAEDAAWAPIYNSDNSILPTNPYMHSVDSDSKGNIWGTMWNRSWPTDSSDVALFKLSIKSND